MKKLSTKERDLVEYDTSDLFSDDISEQGLMDLLSGNTSTIEDRPNVPYTSQEDLMSREQEVDQPMMSAGQPARFPASEGKIKESESVNRGSGEGSSKQEKAKTALEKLNEIRSEFKSKVGEARSEDDRNSFLAALVKTLAQAGAAQSQRNVGMDVGLRPVDFNRSDLNEKRVREDFKTDLSAIEQQIKAEAAGDRGQMTPAQRLRYELSQERLLETIEDRKRKAEQFKDAMTRREREDLDKKVARISERIDKYGLTGRTRAMKEIEDYLGKEYGVSLDSPKNVDIEGVGILGTLRPSFTMSQGDVGFRQNVQALANQLLKARSGAAVTDQEYARFLKEVDSGNFSSEANLMTGLRKMRDDIRDQTSNIANTYGKDVFDEYTDRTGLDFYSPEEDPVRDPRIEKMAEENNITYKQAEQIVKKRAEKRGM